jgi:hypothetical protein
MKPHIKAIATGTIALAVFTTTSVAQLSVGGDNASNYSSGDLNGQNLGTGFGSWSVVSNNDPIGEIYAGTFLTNDVTQNGRQSIGSGEPSSVFGLYANNSANATSSAFVDLRRSFASGLPMTTGDSFSWQGSFSFAGGNRGFSLYSGSDWTGEILNLNHGGGDSLNYTVGESSGITLANIFNLAFTVTLTLVTADSIQLQAVAGAESFDQTFSISGAPTTFKWYFSGAPDGSGNYEPFINNLTTVPEPSTYALLGLGAASILWRIRRRKVN